MPLLKYTTKVPAAHTIEQITRLLIKSGAASILTDYDKGRIVSVSFRIETPTGVMPYVLPSNIDKVHKVLANQQRAGEIAPRYATREHAERVAWRILQEWIEAQMALLETEMVTMDQLFMPYLIFKNNQTLYEHLVADGGFEQLALPTGEGVN
ncbi:MAG: hypothetical protein QGM45_11830 [Anaerolineales bacterium]|nr:hypothetical protein [Anaerolineales bacterium]